MNIVKYLWIVLVALQYNTLQAEDEFASLHAATYQKQMGLCRDFERQAFDIPALTKAELEEGKTPERLIWAFRAVKLADYALELAIKEDLVARHEPVAFAKKLVTVHFTKAQIMERADVFDKALEEYQILSELNKGTRREISSLYGIERMLKNMGRFDEMEAVFLQAVEKPDFLKVDNAALLSHHFGMAYDLFYYYFGMGNGDMAVWAYELYFNKMKEANMLSRHLKMMFDDYSYIFEHDLTSLPQAVSSADLEQYIGSAEEPIKIIERHLESVGRRAGVSYDDGINDQIWLNYKALQE